MPDTYELPDKPTSIYDLPPEVLDHIDSLAPPGLLHTLPRHIQQKIARQVRDDTIKSFIDTRKMLDEKSKSLIAEHDNFKIANQILSRRVPRIDMTPTHARIYDQNREKMKNLQRNIESVQELDKDTRTQFVKRNMRYLIPEVKGRRGENPYEQLPLKNILYPEL